MLLLTRNIMHFKKKQPNFQSKSQKWLHLVNLLSFFLRWSQSLSAWRLMAQLLEHPKGLTRRWHKKKIITDNSIYATFRNLSNCIISDKNVFICKTEFLVLLSHCYIFTLLQPCWCNEKRPTTHSILYLNRNVWTLTLRHYWHGLFAFQSKRFYSNTF